MKYILTLEKFKSNLLNKLFRSADLNQFIKHLLERYDIKVSELKDEYFRYIPVNRLKKSTGLKEIKDYEFYGISPIEDTKEITSLEIGDYLVENDGDVGEVTNIFPDGGIRTDIYSRIDKHAYKKFYKISKKHSKYLIKEVDGNYKLKISSDQIWEYGDDGKLDTLSNIMDGNDISSIDYQDQHIIDMYNLKRLVKYPAIEYEFNDGDVILGLNQDNDLKFYTTVSDNKEVDFKDLKKTSDYTIIFDLNKAIKDHRGVSDQKKEREKSREGSVHFQTDDDILKMSRDKLISKLADKYKLSREDLNNIEEYTDFKRIFNKIFEKNPVLVLSNRDIFSDIKKMVGTLQSIFNLINKSGSSYDNNEGLIETGIRELNKVYDRIIKSPLVLYNVDILGNIDIEDSIFWGREYSGDIPIVKEELNKLGDKVKSYIKNFDYDNLNDSLIINQKIQSYNEVADRIQFFLYLARVHIPSTDKKILEYQYNTVIRANIPHRTENLKEYIRDIKTLSKLW